MSFYPTSALFGSGLRLLRKFRKKPEIVVISAPFDTANFSPPAPILFRHGSQHRTEICSISRFRDHPLSFLEIVIICITKLCLPRMYVLNYKLHEPAPFNALYR
jgi:hypothetical protein